MSMWNVPVDKPCDPSRFSAVARSATRRLFDARTRGPRGLAVVATRPLRSCCGQGRGLRCDYAAGEAFPAGGSGGAARISVYAPGQRLPPRKDLDVFALSSWPGCRKGLLRTDISRLGSSLARTGRLMAARGGAYDHEKFRRHLERETARERAARDREERKAYLTSRLEEAAERTDASARSLAELDSVLAQSLSEPVGPLDLAALRQRVPSAPLDLGADAVPDAEPEWERYAPSAPGRFGRMLSGKGRYERAVQEARERFADAVALHEQMERDRVGRVAALRWRYEQRQAEARRRADEVNTEIDRLVIGLAEHDRHAVSEYYQRVVDSIRDSDGFPRARRCAYVPESNLLVVEWDLPRMDVVPEHGEFKYVRTRDEIDAKPVPVATRRSAYQRLIAQVALRSLRLVFGADPGDLVDTVVFNGMIDDVDPATGLDVRPCLITLRATRDQFAPLRLDRVKPVNCIRDHFAADVSEHPDELRAVEPVLTFDMADPRVIEPIDVLSEIDRRPNLLDLSPTEFEHFVQNLFAKMGLEVQVFRPGGDAGIDCVVHDTTSIFGGKYCIQAKLYRKTVPPTAVRDLFGAVNHEGATKGILITTSGFSKATYTWAKGKPLELIDGTGLLAHCNRFDIPARILR
jgi:restriction system protein